MSTQVSANGQRRWWRAIALSAAFAIAFVPATSAQAVVVSALTATTSTATTSTATASTDVDATVEKSVAQLIVTWVGYVNYKSATGYTWTKKPVEAVISCSGFFVSTTGHMVTAGHCVDPAGGRKSVINEFLLEQVSAGNITEADAASILPGAISNWKVEGSDQGSPPARTIYVGQPKAVAGAVVTEPLVAQMLDFRPSDEGDVALLKVEIPNTPPLSIATVDPKSGSALTSVGFPASVGSVVDTARIRASFKSGTASSQQISPTGVAQTEVNADISPGMSGGPTVDSLGNVLGVNSFGILGETQAFNFITDTTDLRDWLLSRAVPLAPVKVAPVVSPKAAAPVAEATPMGFVILAVLLLLVVGGPWWLIVRWRGRRRLRPSALAPASVLAAAPAPNQAAAAPVSPDVPPDVSSAIPPTSAVRYCGSCGVANPTGAKFCSGCGQRLG
jgi:S1-C subfamily serine protease